MNNHRYIIANTDVLMNEGFASQFVRLCMDKACSEKNIMQNYFSRSFKIFISRLHELQKLNRSLTEQEEKEFKFMMQALIEAKNSSHSER